MKENKPKLSIVIPVYNGEEVIERCVSSLSLLFNHEDIEIIVIDDGSSDKTYETLLIFSEIKNIRLFKTRNNGQGSARNFAIECSTGTFLAFLDADDYIDCKLFLELISIIDSSVDMYVYGFNKVDEEGRILETIHVNRTDPLTFSYSAWNKIIKKSIILDYNLYFLNAKIYEDFAVVPFWVTKCQKVNVIDKAIYNYVISQSSTVRTLEDNVFSLTDIIRRLLSIESDLYIKNIVLREVYRRTLPRVSSLSKRNNDSYIYDSLFLELNGVIRNELLDCKPINIFKFKGVSFFEALYIYLCLKGFKFMPSLINSIRDKL